MALIEQGNSIDALTETGTTPLMLGASGGSRQVVEYLIEAGANVNFIDSRHGMTPLMWCLASMHPNRVCIPIVKALLNAGASPAAVSKDNYTALMLAEQRKCQELVDLLKNATSK